MSERPIESTSPQFILSPQRAKQELTEQYQRGEKQLSTPLQYGNKVAFLDFDVDDNVAQQTFYNLDRLDERRRQNVGNDLVPSPSLPRETTTLYDQTEDVLKTLANHTKKPIVQMFVSADHNMIVWLKTTGVQKGFKILQDDGEFIVADLLLLQISKSIARQEISQT